MEFYVSGTVVTTLDPLGIIMDNIYIDMTNLIIGFNFDIKCNYPEANKDTMNKITNFTAYTPPGINPKFSVGYLYSGLGNITMEGINLSQFYTSREFSSPVFAVLAKTECLGEDGLTQTIDVQNMNFSLKENELRTK